MGIGAEIFVDSTGGPSTSLYVVKTVKTAKMSEGLKVSFGVQSKIALTNRLTKGR